MFFRKKGRAFRLRIDRERAELERKLFENEPDAVKAKLKTCKAFMVVFIPIGVTISFLTEVSISLLLLVGLGVASFIAARLNGCANRKLISVPAVCLVTGFLLGQFILKKAIRTILG